MTEALAPSLNSMLGSIPSPARAYFSLGPLTVRAYGIAIGVGVVLAVLITARRWRRFVAEGRAPGGRPDAPAAMAVWAVPAGLVGARLYHVITDFDRYRGNLGDAVKLWQGGLGIWGGVAAGVLVGWWWARRNGQPVAPFLDAVAPGIAVGQAVGRIGNWFNQELYGRPTDVPWALEIDPWRRVAGYGEFETFHPTFAYEAVWNLGLAAVLVWAVPRVLPRLRQGYLFAVYVFGYTAGRVWIELLRIDDANTVLGLRVNVWTSIVLGFAGLAAVLVGLRPARDSGSGNLQLDDVQPDDVQPDGGGGADDGDAGDADADAEAKRATEAGAT